MAAEGGDSDMCWICLEEASENGDHQLVSPCKCPRTVHPQCLARWQLQQAGRHEEKFCRFCNNELADWKRHLTPEELKPEVSKVQPIMVVYFEGQIHRIPVKQGPDGLDEFTCKIRELFRLPEDVDISLTFGCKEPMSGSHLKLEGMGAFDAAVHCASVAAAERQQKIKKSYSTGNLGSTPALCDGSAPRSASSTNMVPAADAALSPATPPSAAGASAAAPAAQGRRQAFPALQQQQQPRQGTRSRSFSAFSSHGPQSTGAEPPAAFRSILGMLNTGSSPQAPAAAGRMPQPPTSQPQASPRPALPPASPVRFAEPPAAATAAPSAQRQQQHATMRRDRLSLRQISELRDVPELDETVAVGGFSGRFKFHLKAFSRKVARSLSFTSKGAGSSMGSAASMEELRAYSITSNSSSRVGSVSSSPVPPSGSPVPAGAQYGRAVSPMPPGIVSC